MYFKLFKIFASNIFSFSNFWDGFKKGPKGIVKSILLLLLFIYVIAAFGVMYVGYMLVAYKTLQNAGNTELMPFITTLLSLCVIFFFGFTSVATNYYTGSGEEQFISMPISSCQFFGAKFAVSLVTDAFIGLVMFAISAGIYGYNEHLLAKPMFYVGTITVALAFSVAAVFIIYLLLSLILYFIPAFRKKSILTGIASFLIVSFSIGYGFLASIRGQMLSSENMFEEGKARALTDSFARLKPQSSAISFFSKAMNGDFFSILVMIATVAFIIFACVPLLGTLYIKTLNGFSDVKTKKITDSKVESLIKKDTRSNTIFHALFVRDVKTIFREPAFFANGPLMVFLMPIIIFFSFGVSFATSSGGKIAEILYSIQDAVVNISAEQFEKTEYYICAGGMAFVIFLGNCTNIAASSFSREGKALYDLKAMPIMNSIIVKVKFWHAMMYVIISNIIFASLIIAASLFFKFPFTPADIAKMILLIVIGSISVSVAIIFVDMFVDTANPKLSWENPIAAVKQNMNTAIAAFFTIFVIALAVALTIFVLPKSYAGIIIFSAVFVVISALLGTAYFKYAEKRITDI